MLKLTQLESGLPCWVQATDISMINSGVKMREVKDVVIGEDNTMTFAKLSLKNGQFVNVREDPAAIAVHCEPQNLLSNSGRFHSSGVGQAPLVPSKPPVADPMFSTIDRGNINA